MVTCTATQNTLCTDYIALGNWIGLAVAGTAPGATATPAVASEATGGSPAYARQQATWGSVAGGSATTTAGVTINVNSGTYAYMILASASTVGAANMVDNCTITSVTMSAQGQIVVTPTFAQT
jgi:hypothetical protein